MLEDILVTLCLEKSTPVGMLWCNYHNRGFSSSWEASGIPDIGLHGPLVQFGLVASVFPNSINNGNVHYFPVMLSSTEKAQV